MIRDVEKIDEEIELLEKELEELRNSQDEDPEDAI